MTTKNKIIGGFLLTTLLLVGIAVLGYRSIQATTEGFTEYRRLARFNLATSDMETQLTRAAYNAFRFLDTRDPEMIKQAGDAVTAAEGKIAESGEFVRQEDRIAVLADLSKGAKTLREELLRAQESVTAAYAQYEEGVQDGARAIQKALLELGQQARAVNNSETLYALLGVLEDLSSARSGLGRFAESRLQSDADRIRGYLDKMTEKLKALDRTLQTEGGRQLYGVVMTNFDELVTAFTTMETRSVEAESTMAALEQNLDVELKSSGKLSGEVNEQMLAFGSKLVADNETAQTEMLIISVVGVILGIVCATLIIFGIVRVLTDLARFAGAVAEGDFSRQIRTREKGEIGKMVAAMRQIPEVLERVISEAGALSNDIMSGRFRDRLDEKNFSGEFGVLANSVNSVGNAYTTVLDSLPVPVMACDKNCAILFLNQTAQGAVGGNLVGEKCGDQLKAPVCGTKDCFGKCTMDRNANYAGETDIHPQGNTLDVSVAALPLHDLKGEVVGFMEILTDLTEIKGQQRTMLQVAHDASEISDRVAAAAEELSAQVEQISQGAEMQRERVESTASAMTEMNSTVLEVARNAGEASEQANETRNKAEHGSEMVNKVIEAINQVNAVAMELEGNMQELGAQAEAIGGVMNVISDIADQTNLLALNAAIEAARAGEAGRGFAVVADEVRKLAEKTMSATTEVGSSIQGIQHSTTNNITRVTTAGQSVVTATELASTSGEALQEILDLVAKNSALIAGIATAAEEQSATSEEINRAVDEINIVVGETSQGMLQSSAAVQDLSRMAQELRTVMDKLK